MPATLAQLGQIADATVRGNPELRISGAAGIRNAREGEIALVVDASYVPLVPRTAASALLVATDFDPASTQLPLLVAEEPAEAFDRVAAHLHPDPPPAEPGIHETAVVAPDALLGAEVAIHAHCVVESGARVGAHTVLRPGVFVGRDAVIGEYCLLHPHVAVLDRCTLGDRVVLHAGVVIGADGYGYETRDGVHYKIPQRGIVEVGDDVEIGANTTVDRARYGRTVVGSGTKIDDLVMVAHNVVVGDHSLLIAQCGIAGSTALGHHVTVAAQAGIVGHIEIGDQAIVGAQAGVVRDVPPGQIVLGSPAQDLARERRALVVHQRLPDLAKRVRALATAVEQLQQRINHLECGAEDRP